MTTKKTTQTTRPAPDDWVEIITADGARGHTTTATAIDMITHHGARMAPADTPPTDSQAGSGAWEDDGGRTT